MVAGRGSITNTGEPDWAHGVPARVCRRPGSPGLWVQIGEIRHDCDRFGEPVLLRIVELEDQDAQNDGQWVIRIGRVIAPRLSAVRQGRFFGRFGFEV